MSADIAAREFCICMYIRLGPNLNVNRSSNRANRAKCNRWGGLSLFARLKTGAQSATQMRHLGMASLGAQNLRSQFRGSLSATTAEIENAIVHDLFVQGICGISQILPASLGMLLLIFLWALHEIKPPSFQGAGDMSDETPKFVERPNLAT